VRRISTTLFSLGLCGGLLNCASPAEEPESPTLPVARESPTADISQVSGTGVSALVATCGFENGYGYIPDCWSPSYTIQLQIAPSAYQTFQQDAVDDWNFYLTQDALSPRLRVNPGNSSDDVTTIASENGASYCGTFAQDRSSITIRSFGSGGSCQSNAHVGSWSAAYRQELAGVLGWSEGVEQAGLNLFESGLTTHCVLYLDPTPPNGSRFINPYVCAHEADGIIRAYRGQAGTVGVGRMFRDTLYMHASLHATSSSVSVGDSVQVLADSFYSGGFGSGDPALSEVRGHIPVAKTAAAANVQWFQRGNRLTSRGNGWFVATSQGPAWVGVRATGSSSAATRWWVPLQQRGDSLALSVDPAPLSPFIVISDQTPIISEGLHLFTSQFGGSPSTVYWQVDDSRTIGTDPDTTFSTSGQSVWLNVGAGSYTLRFRVSTVPDPQHPAVWHEQDIPVCTEEGQNLSAKGMPGGGSTNAVGGCPAGSGS